MFPTVIWRLRTVPTLWPVCCRTFFSHRAPPHLSRTSRTAWHVISRLSSQSSVPAIVVVSIAVLSFFSRLMQWSSLTTSLRGGRLSSWGGMRERGVVYETTYRCVHIFRPSHRDFVFVKGLQAESLVKLASSATTNCKREC